MNAERLLKLAEKLDTVPSDSFLMDTWYLPNRPNVSCGFIACAAGWAGTIPEFIEAGFLIEYAKYGTHCRPVFGDRVGFESLESFFEINREEASWLFNSDDENDNANEPWYVAEKIREFVERGKI